MIDMQKIKQVMIVEFETRCMMPSGTFVAFYPQMFISGAMPEIDTLAEILKTTLLSPSPEFKPVNIVTQTGLKKMSERVAVMEYADVDFRKMLFITVKHKSTDSVSIDVDIDISGTFLTDEDFSVSKSRLN